MNDNQRLAVLVADLGYGDAGKGSMVDALTRYEEAHTVIRYNGGAQAAHNVVTPDGHHHTFAQFGSGTLVPGVRTHLSRFMLLHPLAMLAEERHLQTLGVTDAFDRTSLEREALIITPFHQAANRLKEMVRGDARHGSCGLGIGETMSDWLTCGSDALFAGDLNQHALVVKKLKRLRDLKITQLEDTLAGLPHTGPVAEELKVFYDPQVIAFTADVYQRFASQVSIVGREYLAKILGQPGTVIFEGAQGVLLDEWWGFYPYNTWSTLTYQNADTLLAESAYDGQTFRLGLIRGYATRHGAGPFVTADARLTEAVPDLHNRNNLWQQTFRVGYLDLLALRYALGVTGRVDGLGVTHLDRMAEIPVWRVCNGYRYTGSSPVVSEYFDFQDGIAQDIRIPADPTDLVRQERLTRLLMEMSPVEEIWEHDLEDYPARIARALGLPLAATSAGLTALEKDFYLELSQLTAQKLPVYQ